MARFLISYGLEKLLADSFPINRSKKNYYTPMINLVRYADDFIITGESKELLENHVKPLVIEFLQARGLTLSEEKTKITHIEEGFDFLGFNIRKYKGKFITKPSKKSRKRFLDKVREIVDKNKSSKQQSLMKASGAWWVSSCCSGTSKSGNSTATSPCGTSSGTAQAASGSKPCVPTA